MAQQTKPLTPRKRYAPPRLTRFGTVRELTLETGCNNEKDGGSHAHCRRT